MTKFERAYADAKMLNHLDGNENKPLTVWVIVTWIVAQDGDWSWLKRIMARLPLN